MYVSHTAISSLWLVSEYVCCYKKGHAKNQFWLYIAKSERNTRLWFHCASKLLTVVQLFTYVRQTGKLSELNQKKKQTFLSTGVVWIHTLAAVCVCVSCVPSMRMTAAPQRRTSTKATQQNTHNKEEEMARKKCKQAICCCLCLLLSVVVVFVCNVINTNIQFLKI